MSGQRTRINPAVWPAVGVAAVALLVATTPPATDSAVANPADPRQATGVVLTSAADVRPEIGIVLHAPGAPVRSQRRELSDSEILLGVRPGSSTASPVASQLMRAATGRSGEQTTRSGRGLLDSDTTEAFGAIDSPSWGWLSEQVGEGEARTATRPGQATDGLTDELYPAGMYPAQSLIPASSLSSSPFETGSSRDSDATETSDGYDSLGSQSRAPWAIGR